MSTPSTPDAYIMRRLGHVRLLYQQAVAESFQPVPFCFKAIRSLYDVCEDFFIIAVQHLRAIDKNGEIDFKLPFITNLEKLRAPDGKLLSARDAVKRISDHRHANKHNGTRAAADAGDLDEAMGNLALAFDSLVRQWGRGKRLAGSGGKLPDDMS